MGVLSAFILTSEDQGRSWHQRAAMGMSHARLFRAGKALYYLGQRGDLPIARSDDHGETWSAQVALTKGQSWHQSACNVWPASFHISYDATTKLYWLLSSQATDSMRRPDRMPEERYDLPNNERHRLVLHFSRNMVDWCFAAAVAITESPKQAALRGDGHRWKRPGDSFPQR